MTPQRVPLRAALVLATAGWGGLFAGCSGAAPGTPPDAGGGRPARPSAGCTAAAPSDPIQKPVEHDLTTTVAAKYQPAYVDRKYYTTLPKSWDPTKPYPVVFYGPGCGATGPEGSPFTGGTFAADIIYVEMIAADVTGQTVVPSNAAPGCFQTGKEGLADSPDGPYFDQALAELSAKYCIDLGRVYVAGSSSGAWLTNYLVCARGDVIRGGVADSGGLQHDHGTCLGGAAIMEMPGDATSSIVDGFDIGAAPARDTLIAANGDATTSTDVTFGDAHCRVYAGGAAPVAWCNVGGAHQSGLGFMGPASWAFFATLP